MATDTKTLRVPYFSQRDNQINPSGACNVTSIAMALYYHGIRGDGTYRQLEDQMYKRCEYHGWSRHDPHGLKKLAESYPGIKDDLLYRGTLSDIRMSIDAGNPVVIHGYFTRFGHIICIIGYLPNGFIVHDPWGEWFPTGYVPTSGKALKYSTRLISQTCSPESVTNPSHFVMHSISREK